MVLKTGVDVFLTEVITGITMMYSCMLGILQAFCHMLIFERKKSFKIYLSKKSF